MGVLIKWQTITSGSDYNHTRIYRSATEDGSYSLITTIENVTSITYYDADGTNSSWYKIAFYDSVNLVESTLSDPIKSDTQYGYCSVEDVRDITSITSSQISDTALAKIIKFASNQINSDMQIHHEDEEVKYINEEKENDFSDGTTTTFYTQKYPIGDLNNDFDVDENDIEVYKFDDDGVRTTLTVSTVYPSTGKFTLSSAPGTDTSKLLLTYKQSQLRLDRDSLHPLVKTACSLLAGAWAFSKLNTGKSPHWRIGNTLVFRDTQAYNLMMSRYHSVLMNINDRLSVVMVQNDQGSFL